MELSIAICDDLAEERICLAHLIETYFQGCRDTCQLSIFSSGEELLSMFQPERFHVVFLDIYMPGLSGMETARRIRRVDRRCAIIFATTSVEHGLESYEVQASDYLVKPFQLEDVTEALDWCLEQFSQAMRCLRVLSEWEQIDIPLHTLRYIEIQGHQAKLHTKDQVILTRRGLDDLESAIQSPDFLRCHRSFLVNMNYITCIEKKDIRLEGGDRVPIGPSSAAQVKRAFADWLFARDWGK